jgi:alkylation response protein AidB-like acyl-CoA dehydrogenase
MPRILNYDIIGCYAQSELGHGSNVKGLETEARWDPAAQEFEIHSPYLTASKWWNGGMGRTATHAVCYISQSSLCHFSVRPSLQTPCVTFQTLHRVC